MSNLQEMEMELQSLQKKVEKLRVKEKKKRGVLKEGEWYLLRIYELDYNDKPSESSLCNVIFYATPTEVVCMNAYSDWTSCYIQDLYDQQPYSEKWSGKKISKEEAIHYL